MDARTEAANDDRAGNSGAAARRSRVRGVSDTRDSVLERPVFSVTHRPVATAAVALC